MAESIPEDVFVTLCDWRGHIAWISQPDRPVKVGDFAWVNLTPESQEAPKGMISKVASLRETQKLQVVNLQGQHYRCWLWPLDSPEVAVCLLARQIPAAMGDLTEREVECLEHLAQGMEVREIGTRLDVSLSTVHTHLKHAREKLGLPGFEALISFAARYCYPHLLPLQQPK